MRHIINLAALLLGIAAALAVCGCCGTTSGNQRAAGVTVDLPGLPPLSQVFTGPPKPVCIPKDSCVAAYGDGWRMLGPCPDGGASVDELLLVPMRQSTFDRLVGARRVYAQPDEAAATRAVEEAPESEYPKILSRTVTIYEDGEPVETKTTTDGDDAGADCK